MGWAERRLRECGPMERLWGVCGLLRPPPLFSCLLQSYQNRQACVAGAAGGQQEDEDSSDSEAADSPSSDERRIIESPPHRY